MNKREELDRLTADRDAHSKIRQRHLVRCGKQSTRIEELQAENEEYAQIASVLKEDIFKELAKNRLLQAKLKEKDKVLRELLAYAEEGLLIDEHLAAHIEQALKETHEKE